MKTFVLAFCAWLASLGLYAQAPSKPLEIKHLTGDFYVFITYNTFRGVYFPANGLYLVTRQGVVLIDSPWDSAQFQPLLDSIAARHGQPVRMCIATHFHADRAAGLAYYRQKGIATFTTRRTDSLLQQQNEARAEFTIAQDTTFALGQYTFSTFYGGPGHSPDNIVLWFPKDRVLYGGCLVKSTDTDDIGNLSDAAPAQWPATIRHIQRKFGKPAYVVPGHQGWQSNKALSHTFRLVKRYLKKQKS